MHYLVQTFLLLRCFLRHVPFRDVFHLIVKPFLGDTEGPTTNETLSRAVEYGALKDAAAHLRPVPDTLLAQVMAESWTERVRLQAESGL